MKNWVLIVLFVQVVLSGCSEQNDGDNHNKRNNIAVYGTVKAGTVIH